MPASTPRRRLPLRVVLLVALASALSCAASASAAAAAAPTFGAPVDLSTAGQVASLPQIAVAASGNALAVWQRSNGTNTIVQSAFRPAGGTFAAPVDLSAAGHDASSPQVAFDGSGNALAVWQRSNGTNTIVQSAFRPVGGTFAAPVDLSAPGHDASSPQVAFDGSGNAIVVWSRYPYSTIQSAFRPAGASFAAAVDLSVDNSASGGSADSPRVAFDPSGNALVVWARGNGTHTIVQSALRPTGGIFAAPVDSSPAGQNSFSPQVAFDASGNAIATWGRFDTTTLYNVFQTSFRPAGGTFGMPTDLGPQGLAGGGGGVTFDAAGNALVAWSANDPTATFVPVQSSFRPAGGAFAAPVILSPAGHNSFYPDAAFDSSGNALVVWERMTDFGTGLSVQSSFRPAGGTFGAPVDVGVPYGIPAPPHLALDRSGNAVVVWQASTGLVQAAFGTAPPKPRSTSTALSCSPTSVSVGNASTCTATVDDTDAGTKTVPGGTVAFTTDGSGAFSAGANCQLTATGATGESSCAVDYTPSAVGAGTHTITATYTGEPAHITSFDTTPVMVTKRSSSAAVGCVPDPVGVGAATICTATITDTDTGTKSAPAGNVQFSSTGAGAFGSGATCTLAPSVPQSACQVTYTPSAVGSGTHTIGVAYPGDAAHEPSSGGLGLTVTVKRSTSTFVTCAPGFLLASESICTVTVSDTGPSSAPATAPMGAVAFTTTESGQFTGSIGPDSCQLAASAADASSCPIGYTPSALGSGTPPTNHTITANYTPSNGDETHEASNNRFVSGVAIRSTNTAVACVPLSVAVGVSTTCTATVADTAAGAPTTPSGTVTFTSGGIQGSLSGPACNLSAAGTCQRVYTPATSGSGTITATYNPDATHATSTGGSVIEATTPPVPPGAGNPVVGSSVTPGSQACSRLAGQAFARCRAGGQLEAALRACARIGSQRRRADCVRTANLVHRRAIAAIRCRSLKSPAKRTNCTRRVRILGP